MKLRTFFSGVLLCLAGLSLAACASSQTNNGGGQDLSVGVIQYTKHEALDAAYDGFIEALAEGGYEEGKNLTISFQNAQGEQANLQTMVEQLAGKNDVNFAIATPAAQALLTVDSETPAVFTAVTDPVAAELVDSLETPGGNMTGSIDASDVSQQIEMLLKVVPEAKIVGIFYNSSEVNSEMQAKAAQEALEEAGIAVVVKTVTTTNDVQQVMTTLASQVDAIYLPTDNTVASTVSTIGDILKEAKVPAIGSDEAFIDAVLFTYGVDFHAIGKQAGRLALEIAEGADPATLPVQKPETASIAVNEEMAEILGISADSIANLKP